MDPKITQKGAGGGGASKKFWPQEASKMAQDGPEMAQNRPKLAQKGPKTAPRWGRLGQHGPRISKSCGKAEPDVKNSK